MLEVARVNKRSIELGAVSPDQVLAVIWSTQSLIDQITKAQPVTYVSGGKQAHAWRRS